MMMYECADCQKSFFAPEWDGAFCPTCSKWVWSYDWTQDDALWEDSEILDSIAEAQLGEYEDSFYPVEDAGLDSYWESLYEVE